tara:strand:+ start:1374 stop:1652 length:279 start_codon:yes stop_codon:yes gene_type:complete
MGLSHDVKCSDCLYFIQTTSICEEYNALVEPEETRNCYFFRAIPKDDPSMDKPSAPKKTVKKKRRKAVPDNPTRARAKSQESPMNGQLSAIT